MLNQPEQLVYYNHHFNIFIFNLISDCYSILVISKVLTESNLSSFLWFHN